MEISVCRRARLIWQRSCRLGPPMAGPWKAMRGPWGGVGGPFSKATWIDGGVLVTRETLGGSNGDIGGLLTTEEGEMGHVSLSSSFNVSLGLVYSTPDVFLLQGRIGDEGIFGVSGIVIGL